jgi:hypothetical protein
MDEDFDIDFIDDIDIDDILSNMDSKRESFFRLQYKLDELDSFEIGSWEDE